MTRSLPALFVVFAASLATPALASLALMVFSAAGPASVRARLISGDTLSNAKGLPGSIPMRRIW